MENNIGTIIKKFESNQADLSAVIKAAVDLEDRLAKLKKQMESVRIENLKAQELLKKLLKIK